MSLRGRITLLAGVLIATFLFIGVVVAMESQRTLANNERLATLLKPVAQRADLITLAQVDAAVALNSYRASGDVSARESFERNDSQAAMRLAELATLTESDPELSALVGQARSAQQAWRETNVSTPGSATSSSAFASMVTASVTLERTLDERRFELSERESRFLSLLVTSLLVTGGIVIAFIALTLWGVKGLVLRPLNRLRFDIQAATDRVTHPITVSGPREFQDVMRDTERMRRALVRNIDEARHAREGLAQQAPLAAALAQFTPPDREVRIGSIAAYGVTQSAQGVVAGDWWDVFACDDGRVGFMLGDISGHGDRATLLATRMRAILRSALRLGDDPARACAQAQMAIDVPHQFATAIVGVITPGSLTFVNAGHPELIVMNAHGVRAEPSTGPLICSLPARWSSKTMPFTPGDTLLMFTDGLVERSDELEQDLGVQDIMAMLKSAPSRQSARGLTEWIQVQVRSGAPSWGRDDVTILCVQQIPLQ